MNEASTNSNHAHSYRTDWPALLLISAAWWIVPIVITSLAGVVLDSFWGDSVHFLITAAVALAVAVIAWSLMIKQPPPTPWNIAACKGCGMPNY